MVHLKKMTTKDSESSRVIFCCGSPPPVTPPLPHNPLTPQHQKKQKTMGLTTETSTGSAVAKTKTPLVTKAVARTGKGMIFTFTEEDLQIRTFISRDPVFDGVVGFQGSVDFLTESMVERLKSEVSRVWDDVDTSDLSHPLSHEEAVELLSNFRKCMKKCKGGETCGASFTALTTF